MIKRLKSVRWLETIKWEMGKTSMKSAEPASPTFYPIYDLFINFEHCMTKYKTKFAQWRHFGGPLKRNECNVQTLLNVCLALSLLLEVCVA